MSLAPACSDDQTSNTVYRNALTGEECEPNLDTLIPKRPQNEHGQAGEHGNGNTSPTGIPGDNLDDLRSGKIDCLGDGDSGQGNDARKCEIEGCDDQLCCEDDGDDDGSADDGSDDDGDDDGSADDGSDDGAGDDGADDGTGDDGADGTGDDGGTDGGTDGGDDNGGVD